MTHVTTVIFLLSHFCITKYRNDSLASVFVDIGALCKSDTFRSQIETEASWGVKSSYGRPVIEEILYHLWVSIIGGIAQRLPVGFVALAHRCSSLDKFFDNRKMTI